MGAMKLLRLLVALLFLASFADLALDAQKKTVQVKGYTRKDGTYVPPHTRSAPGSKKTTTTTGTATPSPTTSTTQRATATTPTTTYGVARDEDGDIKRSSAARLAFLKQTGYPNGRDGYVVDHIRPLACGGPDAPTNMQWQTVAEAKAKDRTERAGC